MSWGGTWGTAWGGGGTIQQTAPLPVLVVGKHTGTPVDRVVVPPGRRVLVTPSNRKVTNG